MEILITHSWYEVDIFRLFAKIDSADLEMYIILWMRKFKCGKISCRYLRRQWLVFMIPRGASAATLWLMLDPVYVTHVPRGKLELQTNLHEYWSFTITNNKEGPFLGLKTLTKTLSKPAWKAWGCEICLPLVNFGYLSLPYWALLALLGLTGHYWVLLGFTGPYRALFCICALIDWLTN